MTSFRRTRSCPPPSTTRFPLAGISKPAATSSNSYSVTPRACWPPSTSPRPPAHGVRGISTLASTSRGISTLKKPGIEDHPENKRSPDHRRKAAVERAHDPGYPRQYRRHRLPGPPVIRHPPLCRRPCGENILLPAGLVHRSLLALAHRYLLPAVHAQKCPQFPHLWRPGPFPLWRGLPYLAPQPDAVSRRGLPPVCPDGLRKTRPEDRPATHRVLPVRAGRLPAGSNRRHPHRHDGTGRAPVQCKAVPPAPAAARAARGDHRLADKKKTPRRQNLHKIQQGYHVATPPGVDRKLCREQPV